MHYARISVALFIQIVRTCFALRTLDYYTEEQIGCV